VTNLRLPFEWEQGEHMTVIGDTGSGKTTVMYGLDGKPGLLDYRRFAVALRSKGDDAKWMGSKRIFTAEPFMLDPKLPKLELFPKRGRERDEFRAAIKLVWKQKKTAIYFDEAFHSQKLLKLQPEVEDLMTRGRSLGITVINGLQRPVSISRFCISQSKHVLVFGQEGRDAKTVADATTPRMLEFVENLPRYSFAWFERSTRQIWTGSLQDLWG